jgi:hypothetical protein
VLEAQLAFANSFLELSRIAKEFGLSAALQSLLDTINTGNLSKLIYLLPTIGPALAAIQAAAAVKTAVSNVAASPGFDVNTGLGLSGGQSTEDAVRLGTEKGLKELAQQNRPLGILPFSSGAATLSAALGPSAPVTPIAPSAGWQAPYLPSTQPTSSTQAPTQVNFATQAAELSKWVAAMGPAVTMDEQLSDRQLKLNAAWQEGALKLSGMSDADAKANRDRGAAALDLQSLIEKESARISILGQSASVSEVVSQKQDEINLKRGQSKNVTDAEVANVLALTAAQNLGTLAMKAQADAFGIEAATVGQAIGPSTAYRLEQEQIAAALRNKKPLSDADIAALHQQAQAAGDAAQALEKVKIASDIKRDSATLFFTDTDVQIANKLKGLYGDDIPAAMRSSEAAQLQFNARIKEVKDLAESFTNNFVQGLLQGKTAMQSLQASAQQLASTLATSAIKDLIGGNYVAAGIEGVAAIGASLFGKGSGTDQAAQAMQQAIAAAAQAQDAWAKMAKDFQTFIDQMAGIAAGALVSALAEAKPKPEQAPADRKPANDNQKSGSKDEANVIRQLFVAA